MGHLCKNPLLGWLVTGQREGQEMEEFDSAGICRGGCKNQRLPSASTPGSYRTEVAGGEGG